MPKSLSMPADGPTNGPTNGLPSSAVKASNGTPNSQCFHLSPLPYAYDALEPVISKEKLQWHHDVLHRSIVEKLNSSLAASGIWEKWGRVGS